MKYSSCIRTVKPTKQQPIINNVLALIQSFTSGVMNVKSFAPFISMKYTMAVAHIPPNMPIFHLMLRLKRNENMVREMNCTTVPNTKAIATDRNMPSITDNAFSVLR